MVVFYALLLFVSECWKKIVDFQVNSIDKKHELIKEQMDVLLASQSVNNPYEEIRRQRKLGTLMDQAEKYERKFDKKSIRRDTLDRFVSRLWEAKGRKAPYFAGIADTLGATALYNNPSFHDFVRTLIN